MKERAAKKERLVLQVGIALTTGVFSVIPVAEGAPVLDKVETAETHVVQSGTVTDVTSTVQNNIIHWKDFSVGEGEKVRFDKGEKKNNYLNVITGSKVSEIAGTIEGGKDVYLINSKGVIFSHGAQVDVGNLYVSTENTDAAIKAFKVGKTAGEVLSAGTANADVVNLGGISANSVIVNGDNIRFVTDDVHVEDSVILQAANSIQKGQWLKTSAPNKIMTTSRGKNPTYVLQADQTDDSVNFIGIKNADALGNIKDLNGHYALTDDIDLANISFTPIGESAPFTGTFDGNFYSVENINVSGKLYGGLFGQTNGATIRNVGVRGGSVSAGYAGGIIGKAENTKLENVYNAGVKVSINDTMSGKPYRMFFAGGIVGHASGSSVSVAYNTGIVSDNGGGIVGYLNNSSIKDAYNNSSTTYGIVGASNSNQSTSSIDDVYTTGSVLKHNFYKGTVTNYITSASSKNASAYDVLNGVSASGKDDTTWRIYEGRTLPLLRAFLRRGKGAVTVNYNYSYGQGENSGSNGGADLKLEYNAKTVNISDITYTAPEGLTVDSDKIKTTFGASNPLHNANDYAGAAAGSTLAFYTDQDGYDLIGNNIAITPRSVEIKGNPLNGKKITKQYDGTADALDEVKALFDIKNISINNIIQNDDTIKIDTDGITAATFQDKDGSAGKNVGINKNVTITGMPSIKNKEGYHNYAIINNMSDLSVTGDITPVSLTLKTNDNALTKVYEGKKNAATKETVANLVSSGDTLNGVLTVDGKKDDVSLSFADTTSTGTYGTKNSDGTFTADGNAGNHDVRLAGITLTGADAGNYNLVDASGTVIYGPKYTAAADEGSNSTLVDVTDGTAYLSGTITKRNLTADGYVWYKDGTAQTATKEYENTSAYADADGQTVNKAGGNAGLVAGDAVSFTVNSAHFVNAKVTGGVVTVSNNDAKNVKDANGIAYNVKVTGEDAKNYTLNNVDIVDGGEATVYGEGSITPRTLLVGAAGGKVFEKTYDGDKTIKTSDGRGTAKNPFTMADGYLVYTGDDRHQLLNDGATITYTGIYSDPNVARDATSGKATTKDVTFTAQVKDADGQPSQNYVFLNGDSKSTTMAFVGKGIINPAKITAVTFDDASKQYDSTSVNSSITMTGATGLVNGESFSDILQAGTDSQYVVQNGDTYQETPHVNATNASYTVSLQNPLGNYDLALPQDAQGHYLAYGKGTITPLTITKITLNPKANTHITKVYDGNNDVTHVENGQTVEAKSYVTTLEADIPNSTNKLTFTQDAPSLGYTVEDARFDEKNSHNSQVQNVTYYLKVKGPDGFADYTFDASLLDQEGRVKAAYAPQGVITPREVKPVVKGSVTKVFDGTRYVVGADGTKLSGNQLVDLQGILAADQGSVTNGTTAVYQNANVNRAGNYEDGKGFVQYTYQLDGDANGNYHLTQTSDTGDGTITPRHLTYYFYYFHKTYFFNN